MYKKAGGVSLALTFAVLSYGQSALADETIVVPAPAGVVVPVETTITAPAVLAPTEVVMPATVVVPPEPAAVLTPEVKETKTTVIKLSEPTATTTTTSILTAKPAGIPNFRVRLNLMEEQIKEGLAKGFLTQAQADSLLAEHARIAGMEQSVHLPNFEQSKSDMVERSLNALNIAIHRSMEGRSYVAGTGILQ